MSLWEFLMTIEGWKLANNVGGDSEGSPKPPTEDEFEKAMAMLD
jgi:hypothetical protein